MFMFVAGFLRDGFCCNFWCERVAQNSSGDLAGHPYETQARRQEARDMAWGNQPARALTDGVEAARRASPGDGE